MKKIMMLVVGVLMFGAFVRPVSVGIGLIGLPDCGGTILFSVIAADGVGPYNYTVVGPVDAESLNDPNTSFLVLNAPAGLYQITIVDLGDYDNTASLFFFFDNDLDPDFPITVPMEIDTEGTNRLCGGQENGIITASPQNGLAPYQATLFQGFTQIAGPVAIAETGDVATFNGLSAGDYIVQIEDANGCLGGPGVIVPFPYEDFPAVSVSICPPCLTFCEGSCGKFTAVATGGSESFTYQWSDSNGPIEGATSSCLIVSCPGKYSVEATDENGCFGTACANAKSVICSPIVRAINEKYCLCQNLPKACESQSSVSGCCSSDPCKQTACVTCCPDSCKRVCDPCSDPCVSSCAS